MMGWYRHDMGARAWTFMGLFWIVIIGLVVVCIVTLVTTLAHRGSYRENSGSYRENSGNYRENSGNDRDSRDQTATDILDRRFAQGEIDEETFLAHRAALTSPRRDVDDP
jgi:putative membrane protein